MSKGFTDKLPCPCKYECSRNGDCDACIAFHRKIKTLTACMEGFRSESAAACETASEPSGPGRVLTLADRPHLTDYAACAG